MSVSLRSRPVRALLASFPGTPESIHTTAVSDVYQDLFGEGSYRQGLYDVDLFEQALHERVPENFLLSHDLFESLFARAALVTDIELLDDYPAHYDSYGRRQHRWTRGDWQIARWLFPSVPDEGLRPVRNRLPLISRWKILDNLRRSLTAPAMILWLLGAWTIFPGSPWWWTLFPIISLAFPVYLHLTTSVMVHPRGIPGPAILEHLGNRTDTAQFLLTFLLLAHQACMMIDAICRTFIASSSPETSARMGHSRQARLPASRFAFIPAYMWQVELLTIAAATLILYRRPAALVAAAPFLLAWAISPLVSWWVSRPPATTDHELTAAQVDLIRRLTRYTWRFFETFVNAESNWLPPDNFQEDPRPVLAQRTSPTNIGLQLLSSAAAHDLGYLGMLEFTERQELTFASLGKMPKFRGHFFNWYDNKTLQPLNPHYISTVDSGNLAGHLIAFKQFCIDLQDTSVVAQHSSGTG